MIDVESIEKLSIDKSDWERVKFGDVVTEPKESVKDLHAEGIEHVVGLEHIDSEEIHLERSEGIEESTTFTKRFSKNDVLFGRRRAYLKKAAKADFEGVCSGDITVMRVKEGLIPELLPFLVNNDKFFDYAVTHSAGGLSPRVKFKDLSKYEFKLPPKNIQKELASLFLALDDLIQKDRATYRRFRSLEISKAREVFLSDKEAGRKTPIGYVNCDWECFTLQELIDNGTVISHLDGNHGSYYPKSNEFVEDGVPYISANCIEDGEVLLSKAKYLTEERASVIKKGVALDGDVLLAHNATVGPVAILKTDLPRIILSTTLTHFRVDPEKLDREYLYYFMQSRLFQGQLERVMKQSTRNQVPITTQRKLFFVVPPVNIQRELVSGFFKVVEVRKAVERKIFASKRLQSSIANQVF